MLTEIEPGGGWICEELERLEAEIQDIFPVALTGDFDAAWRVLTLIDIKLELLGVTTPDSGRV